MDCPYCGSRVKKVDGVVIYGARRLDLAHRQFWACQRYPACDAYVGCHQQTHKPYGRLADKELRRWKMSAHAAFDPLWKRKADNLRSENPEVSPSKAQKRARTSGYQWLAAQLAIAFEECHIGMFDVAMCKRVVELCQPYSRRLSTHSPHQDDYEIDGP